jgi:5-oxoprolinase (ATP-hydrolysing) subunit C
LLASLPRRTRGVFPTPDAGDKKFKRRKRGDITIPYLRLLTPGLHTLIVDHGRPRWRSLGVPVGGAADRFALAIGNALVGNPPDAAALEISLNGPTLTADSDIACVLYGAPFEMTIDGSPQETGKTFTLHSGEELRIGGTPSGMRAYLCVRGGLQTPTILGSRSSLEPLRAEAELPCQTAVTHIRHFHHDFAWNAEPRLLRVVDGGQADWFRADEFYRQAFTVTPASNRMGLRLSGLYLSPPETGEEGGGARELVSEPVCPGSVQVTRDGQCIVLGVDGQTIGGYPKIAQVVSADLDKLAQLRPGESIRFERVTLETAEALYRAKQIELREWLTRLRTAEAFAAV